MSTKVAPAQKRDEQGMTLKEREELDDYCKIDIDLFNLKRHQKIFVGFMLFYNVSFAIFYRTDDIGFVTLWQLPLACLVMFGCYALINIGYHMLTLEDCEEAHNELMKDIKEARKFLAKKGMKFDAHEK